MDLCGPESFALNKTWFPPFLLLILAFVWGSSFILMDIGLFGTNKAPLFSSWQVGALRIGFAGLVLLPVVISRINRISWRDYAWMAAVGIVGNTIPAFSFTYAQTVIDSNFAGILNGLTPFFALFIAAGFFGAKVKWLQLVGIGLGLLGATGLATQQELDLSLSWWHIGVVVMATACYGVSVNLIAYKLKHRESLTIAAFALLTGGIPCTIYALWSGVASITLEHPQGVLGLGAIAVLGIVGTAAALGLFNWLIQLTSGTYAASVTYLIPVFAMMWGALNDEYIGPMHLLWTVVIFSGVYLVNKGRTPKAAVESAES